MSFLFAYLVLIVVIMIYAVICYMNSKAIKTIPYFGVIAAFWVLLPWYGKFDTNMEYENVYKWFLVIRDIVYVIVSVGMLALSMKMSRKKHIIIRLLYCGSVLAVNLWCAYNGRIHWC